MRRAEAPLRELLRGLQSPPGNDPDSNRQRLRALVRERRLGDGQLDQVGRALQRQIENGGGVGDPRHVLLLGQCTTHWLANALRAEAFGQGELLNLEEGGFDTVLQDLEAVSVERAPDVVILLPWHTRLLDGPERSLGACVEDEMHFWRATWNRVRSRLRARLVQVGYDWVIGEDHQVRRTGGNLERVEAMNTALLEELPEGAFLVDLAQVSGRRGRENFYDARRYFWTRQPFSEGGVNLLARHLWSGIRAVTTGPRKVLVLDLDNTLWGGVVGETGPLAIELGESPQGRAFRAFQSYVKSLAGRGVVLAVASKNNPDDARAPFQENPDMVLELSDLAAFEACWTPKSGSLQRIAEELRLGLDSFVFFDDNPAEREEVRQALPEVEVVEVPEDPSDFIAALRAELCFESVLVTDADRQRTDQYRAESRRRAEREQAGSLQDYLASLHMEGDLRLLNETDMARVVQLLGKTNQFNLTTRRHSLDRVRQMLGEPHTLGLTLRLRDRFGDHGLVAVLIIEPLPGADQTTLRIDTWLMSCRVIARTVEQFLFQKLVEKARELGYRRIRGEYIPTAKNVLVRDLYPSLGLERVTGDSQGVEVFEADLASLPSVENFVELANPAVA